MHGFSVLARLGLAALALTVPGRAGAQSAAPVPLPAPAVTTPPVTSAYTFDLLGAERQVVATFDAADRLIPRGDLSRAVYLRLSRPGMSRLFTLAAPVTPDTRLAQVQVMNGTQVVTLGSLLQPSPAGQPGGGTPASTPPTPQQLNTALGLSTSVGTVQVGIGTSVGVAGAVFILPLLPLF